MPRLPHHTRRYAEIRALVEQLTGSRILFRRRMAAFLRSLADEIERPRPSRRHSYADAGPPGSGIRWNGTDLLIGMALWRGIGCAKHVTIELDGATTRIRPDPDGDFLVRKYGRHYVTRIACRRIYGQAQWAEGWRPGRIERGAIVFDIEATKD